MSRFLGDPALRRLLFAVNNHSVKLHRETNFAHGSPEWLARRNGKSMGSSECAAVFNTISTTVRKSQLEGRWAGLPPDPISPRLQRILDAGTVMEPELRRELASLLGCDILNYNQLDGEVVYGVEQRSTLDGVAVLMEDEGPMRLAVTEFKWRATLKNDCGWNCEEDKARHDKLGITVFCQVQHQMWVSGIPRALVYTGGPDGSRRLWTVRFSEVFIEQLFKPALKATVEDEKGLPSSVAKYNIYQIMSNTSKQIPLLISK